MKYVQHINCKKVMHTGFFCCCLFCFSSNIKSCSNCPKKSAEKQENEEKTRGIVRRYWLNVALNRPSFKNTTRYCFLTCFEYLVAQREAGSLMGVVGDKSDLEGWPRWDNWPWGDVAAMPPQNIGRLWSSIADLYEVISEKNKRNELDSFLLC